MIKVLLNQGRRVQVAVDTTSTFREPLSKLVPSFVEPSGFRATTKVLCLQTDPWDPTCTAESTFASTLLLVFGAPRNRHQTNLRCLSNLLHSAQRLVSSWSRQATPEKPERGPGLQTSRGSLSSRPPSSTQTNTQANTTSLAFVSTKPTDGVTTDETAQVFITCLADSLDSW